MPNASHKNKIVLSDYNYQRDIENRLLMAELSTFEVDVLREILDGSLKTTVKQLAQHLDSTEALILPTITKLEKTTLFHLKDGAVTVDKEMRKYYESQIIKFDDDFEPGMEFLQSLLSKIPIHTLPNWYSIVKASDNIFSSIIEKFFLTPKAYQQYLEDLEFDEPILRKLTNDVYSSPELKVLSKDLMKKYSLTREQFETYMLLLEFNFVGCLSYNRVDDLWEEVITPFHEWREYLLTIRERIPHLIKNIGHIKVRHENEFGFLADMNAVLEASQKKPVSTAAKNQSADQLYMINKLQELHLAATRSNALHPMEHAAEWLEMPLSDQSLALYRHPIYRADEQYTERDLRQVEKAIKRIAHNGWYLYEDFLNAFIFPVGSAEAVTLKPRGKRWKYAVPVHSQEDLDFIQRTVFKRLYELGMVSTGTYEGKPCFSLTTLGLMTLPQ